LEDRYVFLVELIIHSMHSNVYQQMAYAQDTFEDGLTYIKVYIHGGCYLNGSPNAIAGSTVYFGHNHPLNSAGATVPGPQSNMRASLFAAVTALNSVAQSGSNDQRARNVAIFTNCAYPSQVRAGVQYGFKTRALIFCSWSRVQKSAHRWLQTSSKPWRNVDVPMVNIEYPLGRCILIWLRSLKKLTLT
jgi:ribonuclease HI